MAHEITSSLIRSRAGSAPPRRRWSAVALLATLIQATSACHTTGGDTPPDPPPDPPPPSTRDYDATAYALTAQYDWGRQALLASEDITLVLTGDLTTVNLDSTVEVKGVHAGTLDLVYTAAGAHLYVELAPIVKGNDPVTFTVEYEARYASSLHATTSSAKDPVRSRLVFTDSEPNRGHEWLVQKDDPSDPALFSVTLTVPADEDVVANGERLSDTLVADGRQVAYALDVPIATYLMAFAAGQLEHVDRPTGSSVPLSLWYRRGLPLDPAITLDAVARAMSTFESLLGPYPFSRYSVLLQPLGGWGMENATLTIESEEFGQDPFSNPITVHELAHQWFGDLVTMHGYDDVWIKEGMATLLAVEADRARNDVEGRGRLLASSFSYDPGDAIVDTKLSGLAKYTSGPYYRSAALITQIRAKVGETAFWASVRQFLTDHARGSATGEQFIRSFAPALSEADIQAVLATLPRVGRPALTASLTPTAEGTRVHLQLSDPHQAMLAPYEVTVVDPGGAVHTSPVTASSPLDLDVPTGGYIAPDEGDVHVDFPVTEALFMSLSPVLQPAPGTVAGELFMSRSASHQERTLVHAGLPALAPAEFAAYYDALDSDYATLLALARACKGLTGLSPADRTAWLDVLIPIFHAPRVAQPSIGYACGPELGATFLDELKATVASTDPTRMARLEYLIWFDYGAEGDAVVAKLATSAPTLRLRRVAEARIALKTGRNAAARVPTRSTEGKIHRTTGVPLLGAEL